MAIYNLLIDKAIYVDDGIKFVLDDDDATVNNNAVLMIGNAVVIDVYADISLVIDNASDIVLDEHAYKVVNDEEFESDEEESAPYDEELDGEELIPLNEESPPHEEKFISADDDYHDMLFVELYVCWYAYKIVTSNESRLIHIVSTH